MGCEIFMTSLEVKVRFACRILEHGRQAILRETLGIYKMLMCILFIYLFYFLKLTMTTEGSNALEKLS